VSELRKHVLHAEVSSALSRGVPPRGSSDGPLWPQGQRGHRSARGHRAVVTHVGQAGGAWSPRMRRRADLGRARGRPGLPRLRLLGVSRSGYLKSERRAPS